MEVVVGVRGYEIRVWIWVNNDARVGRGVDLKVLVCYCFGARSGRRASVKISSEDRDFDRCSGGRLRSGCM